MRWKWAGNDCLQTCFFQTTWSSIYLMSARKVSAGFWPNSSMMIPGLKFRTDVLCSWKKNAECESLLLLSWWQITKLLCYLMPVSRSRSVKAFTRLSPVTSYPDCTKACMRQSTRIGLEVTNQYKCADCMYHKQRKISRPRFIFIETSVRLWQINYVVPRLHIVNFAESTTGRVLNHQIQVRSMAVKSTENLRSSKIERDLQREVCNLGCCLLHAESVKC